MAVDQASRSFRWVIVPSAALLLVAVAWGLAGTPADSLDGHVRVVRGGEDVGGPIRSSAIREPPERETVRPKGTRVARSGPSLRFLVFDHLGRPTPAKLFVQDRDTDRVAEHAVDSSGVAIVPVPARFLAWAGIGEHRRSLPTYGTREYEKFEIHVPWPVVVEVRDQHGRVQEQVRVRLFDARRRTPWGEPQRTDSNGRCRFGCTERGYELLVRTVPPSPPSDTVRVDIDGHPPDSVVQLVVRGTGRLRIWRADGKPIRGLLRVRRPGADRKDDLRVMVERDADSVVIPGLGLGGKFRVELARDDMPTGVGPGPASPGETRGLALGAHRDFEPMILHVRRKGRAFAGRTAVYLTRKGDRGPKRIFPKRVEPGTLRVDGWHFARSLSRVRVYAWEDLPFPGPVERARWLGSKGVTGDRPRAATIDLKERTLWVSGRILVPDQDALGTVFIDQGKVRVFGPTNRDGTFALYSEELKKGPARVWGMWGNRRCAAVDLELPARVDLKPGRD